MAKEFRSDLMPKFSEFVTDMALLVNRFQGKAAQIKALEHYYKSKMNGGFLTWIYCVREAEKAARQSDDNDTFFAVIVAQMFQVQNGSFHAIRPSEKTELAHTFIEGILRASQVA